MSVVEFFETRHFFSMVMPLHGEVDLFEFIDRSPLLTEYLASYIYRQVIFVQSAVRLFWLRSVLSNARFTDFYYKYLPRWVDVEALGP